MFSLSATPIAGHLLRRQLENQSAGACVVFEGWVRDHQDGKQVVALDYEAYAPLATFEGEAIIREACGRFPITGALCVHRTGALTIGDVAVWVGVTSPHRSEAFAACAFIIDEVKRRVPIWKHERYSDGSSVWVGVE